MFGAAQAVGQVIRDPVSSVGSAVDYAMSGARVMGPAAEPSPVLRRRSLSSRSEAIDIVFGDLHRAAKAAGGSINDAYLAGLCGALRRYHEAHGRADRHLPMAIPVNMRSDNDPAGGNRFAGVNLAAPIGLVDPEKRIKSIRSQMTRKRDERAIEHGRCHRAGAEPAAGHRAGVAWPGRSSTPMCRRATCRSTQGTPSSPARRSCGSTDLVRCPAWR